MKLIDLAVRDNEMKRKDIINGLCPYNCGLVIRYDPITIEKKKNGLTYGCCGISCKKCWNKEYSEGTDGY